MRKRRTIRLVTEKHGDLAADLRNGIVAGVYPPGSRLPTRLELAVRYHTTVVTVQKAMDDLAAAGFVTSRVGSGTFVTAYPPHLHHFALVLSEQDLSSRYVRALRQEAERLTARGPDQFSIYTDIDRHAVGTGQARLMADIADQRLAGCILDMHPVMLQDNPLLHDRTVPKVALVGDSNRSDMCSISSDVQAWVREGLQQLKRRSRQRIAWLGISNMGTQYADWLYTEARQLGLTTSSAWTGAVDFRFPHWTQNVIAAIFQGASGIRPDGLLIADDNIAEAAVGCLKQANLRLSRDLDVVTLNNFPLPLAVPSAVCQIGFDVRESVAASVATLREMRAGMTAPRTIRIAPRVAQGAAAPQDEKTRSSACFDSNPRTCVGGCKGDAKQKKKGVKA